MSSGTKIILAVAALMVGALALYYGLMPRAAVQPAPGAEVAAHGTPAVEDPLAAIAVGGTVPTAPTNPPPRDSAATPARPPASAAPVGQWAASPPIAAPGTGAVKPAAALPAPGAAAKKPVDYTHYTVRSGDTLSSIAKAVYGDPDQWWLIYESNRVTIGEDPHTLEVGMQLRIAPKR